MLSHFDLLLPAWWWLVFKHVTGLQTDFVANGIRSLETVRLIFEAQRILRIVDLGRALRTNYQDEMVLAMR